MKREVLVNEQTFDQYKGLVWQMVHQYWGQLPSYVHPFYDMEDMAGDLFTHAVWVLQERYDARRGVKPVTYLYWALQNYCRSMLTYYYAQRRTGFPVDATVPFATMESPDTERRRVEVVAAMERLLEDASEELRGTFSSWMWEGTRRITKACAEEMRGLCKKHRVPPQDLRLVLSII